MDEMQELLEDFLIEAFEMIDQMDQDLVELENNPDDLELLNKIFRVAHTIKGSGSFLNFDKLTRLTHHMEAVLDKARKGELKITPDIMDIILESVDAMKAILEYIRDNGTDESPEVDIEPIVQKLDAITKGNLKTSQESEETQEKESEKVGNIDLSEITPDNLDQLDLSSLSPEELDKVLDKLVDDMNTSPEEEGIEEVEEVSEEGQKEEKSEEEKKEGNLPQKQENKTPQTTKTTTPTKQEQKNALKKHHITTTEQTIRVDVKRLDQLMNLIGELVLAKNRLIKIYNDVEERYEGEKFLDELNQVVSSISIVTTDLQIAVMKTRMLPIGKVFNKFPRLVRDLSRELGKKVRLIIEGEDTELDKSIIEEIGDPLVHMIRNSVDHGIEPPEERKKLGKPEEGTVWLRAYNEGNMIVIEIKDDGRGMDPEKLKQKAIEKGIITPSEAENMSDKEAFMLIFKPGFSTAEKVTSVSGRGVGMDVVKTNIRKRNNI